MSEVENFECDTEKNGQPDSDMVEEYELHLGKSFFSNRASTNSHYKLICKGKL